MTANFGDLVYRLQQRHVVIGRKTKYCTYGHKHNAPITVRRFFAILEFSAFKPVALEWTEPENKMMRHKATMNHFSEVFALLECHAE